VSGRQRSCALGLALVLVLLRAPSVCAAPQVTTRTELELSVATVRRTGAPVTVWVASLHLDLRLAYGPSALVLRLDPGILMGSLAQSPWATGGLTEAYLEWRAPRFDFRVGLERMPLEVARLTVPFSIEAVDVLGRRRGRLGARLHWYPDQATRVRLALLEHDGSLHPAVSLRYAPAAYEIEAHALAFGAGRTAFGVGASGLVRALVLYGEAWTLSAPSETRYAVGASGSLTDGLWTVEAGYGAAAVGALARVWPVGGPARWQVAGQVVRRLGGEVVATATARVLSDLDALYGQVSVDVSRSIGEATYSVALLTLLGPEPLQSGVLASVRFAF
jgi:hypothetical protein